MITKRFQNSWLTNFLFNNKTENHFIKEQKTVKKNPISETPTTKYPPENVHGNRWLMLATDLVILAFHKPSTEISIGVGCNDTSRTLAVTKCPSIRCCPAPCRTRVCRRNARRFRLHLRLWRMMCSGTLGYQIGVDSYGWIVGKRGWVQH